MLIELDRPVGLPMRVVGGEDLEGKGYTPLEWWRIRLWESIYRHL